MKAARSKDLEAVRLLIGTGADVNAKDKQGETALVEAVDCGDLLLFSSEGPGHFKANPRDQHGRTFYQRSLEVVKVLIDRGADVNAKDEKGETTLMYAARSGNLEVVKFLVDKGADVNAKDSNGATALSIASANYRPKTVEYLKAYGAK